MPTGPEAPGSGRNWDYRYCWLRDAYYVVSALNRLGAADLLEAYLGYLRTQNFASNEPIAPDEVKTYTVPETLYVNHWGLSGAWKVAPARP